MKSKYLKSLHLAAMACGLFVLTPLTTHAFTSDDATESVPGALTDASLQQMLTAMGYSPKALTKGFLITFKGGVDWTINVQVVLSPNQTKIGLNANLGKVEEANVTAAQWAELLIANGDIDPSAFYFDRKQEKLYLHRSMDNRAVTPDLLRRQIESFGGNVMSTEKLWSFTK